MPRPLAEQYRRHPEERRTAGNCAKIVGVAHPIQYQQQLPLRRLRKIQDRRGFFAAASTAQNGPAATLRSAR
jgi:hypothetical protein